MYAKACARQSGQQLKVLGEAGFKYLSGAVENWRAGTADQSSAKANIPGVQLTLVANVMLVANLMLNCCVAAG